MPGLLHITNQSIEGALPFLRDWLMGHRPRFSMVSRNRGDFAIAADSTTFSSSVGEALRQILNPATQHTSMHPSIGTERGSCGSKALRLLVRMDRDLRSILAIMSA